MKSRVNYFVLLVLGTLIIFLVLPARKSSAYLGVYTRLIGQHDTYGGELNPTLVYLCEETFSHPFLSEENKDRTKLDSSVLDAITEYSAEIGITFRRVKDPSELKYNELREVVGGGVVIRFGKLQNYWVYSQLQGSIHIAFGVSGGGTYDFVKVPLQWLFLYRSGWWMS